MTTLELQALAQTVPDIQYTTGQDLIPVLRAEPKIKELAVALKASGYPNLSKAVGCGMSWHGKVQGVLTDAGMRHVEAEASDPQFSWNRPNWPSWLTEGMGAKDLLDDLKFRRPC